MALSKPPKDYYSLDEVARAWWYSVDELLDYGEQGKIQFCVNLWRDTYAESAWQSSAPNTRLIHEPIRLFLLGVYPVLKEYIRTIRERVYSEIKIEFIPEDKAKECKIPEYIFRTISIQRDQPSPDSKSSSEPIGIESLVITHEEKTRFEKENSLAVADDQEERQPENQTDETDTEMVKRLKLEGKDSREIAHKLRDVFPRITPHRVGKLITEEVGVNVTSDAYRKRGGKLLKKQ